MGGQGTRILTARYLPEASGANITVTVTVDGLPASCPKTASEVHSIEILLGPIHLGAINNPSYAIGKKLLKTIGDEMMANPNSQLYVWIYSGRSEREAAKLATRIRQQLSATEIDPTRVTINLSSEKPRGVIFWRVPPGSDNPAP